MYFKRIKVKILILLLIINLMEVQPALSYDNELYTPCGGDNELIIGCLGDTFSGGVEGAAISVGQEGRPTQQNISEVQQPPEEKLPIRIKWEYFLLALGTFLILLLFIVGCYILLKKDHNEENNYHDR